MASRSDKDKQKQVQDKCQAILGQLLREEDNKYCVDCDAKGPRWASWNLGIFVCIRCAGIHRNLGVHISRVKSVNLDTWTPEQVASLQQMGNSKARAVYEAYLPDNFRRPQTDSSLEAFVRAKYEQKKYIAKEWVPPPLPKPAFDLEEEQKRDRKKKQSSKPTETPAVEVPLPQQQQPAALPRPHGAPLSSGNSPVASTKLHTQKSAASTTSAPNIDLLGLDISPVDQFDSFVSAAPLPVSTATTTVGLGHSSGSTSSNQQNGFPIQQSSQPPPSSSQSNFCNDATAGATEKKTVMSKESILSLYSTASNPQPQQPVFGLQGGMYMAPGMYAPPHTLQMNWPNPNMAGMVDPQMTQAAMQNVGNVAQPAVNVTNPFLSMGLSGLMPLGPNVSQASCHNQLILESNATSNMFVSGQVPIGLGQIQQQMATLQLVNQQWQTGNAMPPNFSAFPSSQAGPIPSRPNMQGHTLSTNLWQ